jgi:hypothetical protein
VQTGLTYFLAHALSEHADVKHTESGIASTSTDSKQPNTTDALPPAIAAADVCRLAFGGNDMNAVTPWPVVDPSTIDRAITIELFRDPLPQFYHNTTTSLSSAVATLSSNQLNDDDPIVDIRQLGGIDKTLNALLTQLTAILSPRLDAVRSQTLNAPLPSLGILLCGNAGVGKSSILCSVSTALRFQRSTLAHTVWIPCSELVHEKRTAIRAYLDRAVREAIASAPTLIVFDDIDKLVPAVDPTDNGSGTNLQTIQLVETVVDALSILTSSTPTFDGSGGGGGSTAPNKSVALLGSVRSSTSFHQSLQLGGLFGTRIELRNPGTTRCHSFPDCSLICLCCFF